LGFGNKFIVAVCNGLASGQSQPLLHKLSDFTSPVFDPTKSVTILSAKTNYG
jgi:hypothetical protein